MSDLSELVLRSKEWLRIIQSDSKGSDNNNTVNKRRINWNELEGSKSEAGSFDDLVLTDNSTDFSSQMFWHISKKTLLEDGDGGCKNSADEQISSPLTNWFSNCQGSGAKCSFHHETKVQAEIRCDCGLSEENLAYTRMVVDQLDYFLACLSPSIVCGSDNQTISKVCEAIAASNEITKMGLNYLNSLLADHHEDGIDKKSSPLATAVSYYATLLAQTNLTVLQMAWLKKTQRRGLVLNMSAGGAGVRGKEISEFITKASKYIIPDKKFIKTRAEINDHIEEVFKVHGLSTTFSKWPVIYICVIWLSKILNEENGGNSSIRFISGLSDSLVMSDWFNTGTSDCDNDKDGSTDKFWIFLGIVFKAAKETFDMRMRLFGDSATAVRGIVQGVHFETKNKIEDALKKEEIFLIDALVKSELDKLPSFNSWLTVCIFDIGLHGIVGCDSVNSLTRIREASFTFLFFNDIVDLRRDWSCGEIRNFLVSQFINAQQLSVMSQSLGLFNKTIAVSIGAYEFILQNGRIYGDANIMAQHCVYPWQVAAGRYGMVRTYLLNIGNYMQEQENKTIEESIPTMLKWKPPIRIVDEHLNAYTHRFDDNFQPILKDSETIQLNCMSVDQLRAKCCLYMGIDFVTELVPSMVYANSLIAKLQMELVRAKLTHDQCKNHLITSLHHLLNQDDCATIIGLTSSISHVMSYFNHQLATKPPVLDYQKQPITLQRMTENFMEIHLKFVMILDICTLAHSRGTPPCATCSDNLGDWIDETCCETALRLEKLIENFCYADRMILLKNILGSCNFSANYMKVPFYELHLRSNLMAVVSQQVTHGIGENNSGDKFTF